MALSRFPLAVCILTALLSFGSFSSIAKADEVPPGVHIGWADRDGIALINELKCNACHADTEAVAALPGKQAPNLKTIGQRATPQYLREYLADPLATKPGTLMPHVLHELSDAERTRTAEALTHYLVSLTEPIEQTGHGTTRGVIEQGQRLYHSVGCVACHQPYESAPEQKNDPYAMLDPEDLAEIDVPGRSKPWTPIPHGNLAKKTTLPALTAFLLDPHAARPSGRMPSLKLDPSEAQAIAAYLLRDQLTTEEGGSGPGLKVAVYRGGFNKTTDIGNREPDLEGTVVSIDVKDAPITNADGQKLKSNFAVRWSGLLRLEAAGEYRFRMRSDDGSVLKLDGRTVIDIDGVHPPITREGTANLEKGDHAIEVTFTQVGGGYEFQLEWRPVGERGWKPIPGAILFHEALGMVPTDIEAFTVDADLAAEGEHHFRTQGCNTCHQIGSATAPEPITGSLATANWSADDGCLSAKPNAKAAKYGLSDAQKTTLANAITELRTTPEPTAETTLHRTMLGLNCYACHQRNEFGGPDITRVAYFGTLVPVDLGDEGRLPPPLNEPGAKLTDAGFDHAFYGKDPYRTFMATRMPHFGKETLSGLREHFREADAGKIPERAPAPFSPQLLKDGRKLVGKTGFGCINCHAWGKYHLQGAEGLNFLEVPGRIREGWFHAFVRDPQQLKRGTRMPTVWPNGRVAFPEIQEGRIDGQLDAIWTYLSAGERAGLPPGLSPNDENLLVPSDRPIVFRTFMHGVGANAICVGFPQQTHIVFDALRVRSAKVWSGGFVSAKPSWEGRAGQYAAPLGSSQLDLPDGHPFAILPSTETAWPEFDFARRTTPSGWQYLGYRLAKSGTPTFLYRFGDVTIEETPSTEYRKTGSVLLRSFKVTADASVRNLYFRIAEGTSIDPEGESFVIDQNYRTAVKNTTASPVLRRKDGSADLLLPIEFDDDNTATFEVELIWK